jgi:predicted transcriptional regulator
MERTIEERINKALSQLNNTGIVERSAGSKKKKPGDWATSAVESRLSV